MRKQVVLCISPDPNDATSFYRGSGPIGEMRKQTDKFEFVPCPKGMTVTWSVLQQADWMFLQRPFTDGHVKMAEMAKANGLKIWCDWDDDILNIPRSNYTHRIYLARNARQNVATIVNNFADFITVSTKHLGEVLGSEHRTNVFVIPNALNTRLFPLESRRQWLKNLKGPLKKKRVFWRGGKTHVEDLLVHQEAIQQIVNEHQDWEFGFVGETEWILQNALEGSKNARIYEAQDVIEYHRTYKNYAAQIAWVPLMDNDFNHSKSMCAWLEATYAGAACIGPSFQEWTRDGIMNYKDSKGLYDGMKQLLTDPELCLDLQEKSVHTIIESGLTLMDTAKARIELLRQYS